MDRAIARQLLPGDGREATAALLYGWSCCIQVCQHGDNHALKPAELLSIQHSNRTSMEGSRARVGCEQASNLVQAN